MSTPRSRKADCGSRAPRPSCSRRHCTGGRGGTVGGLTHDVLNRGAGWMRARDIMTTPVQTISRDTPVREIIQRLLTHRISGVPVVEGERVVGIISEADLILRERAYRQRGGMAYLFQQ